LLNGIEQCPLDFDLGELRPYVARKSLGSPAAEATTPILTITELRELERKNFERALAQCDGQIYGARGAAAFLGMKPTTLWSRIRALGIIIE